MPQSISLYLYTSTSEVQVCYSRYKKYSWTKYRFSQGRGQKTKPSEVRGCIISICDAKSAGSGLLSGGKKTWGLMTHSVVFQEAVIVQMQNMSTAGVGAWVMMESQPDMVRGHFPCTMWACWSANWAVKLYHKCSIITPTVVKRFRLEWEWNFPEWPILNLFQRVPITS